MKPALKVLIWIPVVLIVLIVGFNIFLLTFDLNAYRGRLESLLSETLGRQIELRGKIGFEPSLVPTVSLRDVVIGNPQWASRPAFATAGRVTCQLALMPLLENRIEIARFAIGQADILFERGPNDSNNWKFGRKTATRKEIYTFTGLGDLELEAVTLGYRPAQGGGWQARIDSTSATWPPDTRLNLHAEGSVNGRQFSLTTTAGSVADLFAGESGEFPLDASVIVNDVLFSAKGNLAVPLGGDFNAAVSLSGEDLSGLGRLFDRKLPSRGPFHVSALADHSGGRFRISELQADIPGWGDILPLKVEAGQAEFGADAPTRITIGGVYNEEKYSLKLNGAALRTLREDTGEWPVAVDASFARSGFKARGLLTLPMREARGRFDMDLQIHDGAGLPDTFTRRFSGYLPATLKGTLNAARDAVTLSGADLKAGKTTLSGKLAWGRNQGTPRLDMDLEAGTIDLQPYLASPGERKPGKPGATGIDAPLNTGWLRNWNSSFSLEAASLEGLTVPLKDLVLHGELRESHLTVTALLGTAPGGRIALEGKLDASGKAPSVSATARSREFDLGALLGSIDHGEYVAGRFGKPEITLKGSGSTVRELLTRSRIEARTATSTLSIGKRASPRAIELKAHRFRAISNPAKPVAVSLEGSLNGSNVSTKGTVGTMSSWLQPGLPRKLALVTRARGSQLDLKGDLVLPWTGRIDLRYELTGRQLSRLGALAGRPLPDLRNFSFRGALFLDDDTLDLTDLAAAADDLEAQANLRVTGLRSRPAVSGSIVVSNLNLTSLPGRATNSTPPAREETRYIPEIELPVEALRAIDLKLDLELTNLKWRDDSIGFFRLKTTLKDGDLLVDPVRGDLTGGGNLLGRLEYRASLRTPTAGIDINTNDFNYGRWLNDGDMSSAARGLADFHLDLKGRGRTTKELLATAYGVETVVAGPVKFLQTDRLRLTVNIENLVNAMFPRFLKELEGKRREAGIICFASRWNVSNGIGRSDDIILDGLHTVVAASGAMNLATEKIDMLVYPHDKGVGLIDVAIPVRVTGTIAKPHIEVAEIPRVSVLGFLNLSLANPTHLVETLESLPSVFTSVGHSPDKVDTNRCTEALETSDDKAARGKDPRARGGVGSRLRGLFQRIEGNPTDPQPEDIDP